MKISQKVKMIKKQTTENLPWIRKQNKQQDYWIFRIYIET